MKKRYDDCLFKYSCRVLYIAHNSDFCKHFAIINKLFFHDQNMIELQFFTAQGLRSIIKNLFSTFHHSTCSVNDCYQNNLHIITYLYINLISFMYFSYKIFLSKILVIFILMFHSRNIFNYLYPIIIKLTELYIQKAKKLFNIKES